mgnify:CR=1 FL=1
MKEGKVVVIGFSSARQTACKERLWREHGITNAVFVTTPQAMLEASKEAIVIVIHLNDYPNLMDQVVSQGYEGALVAVATSKSRAQELVLVDHKKRQRTIRPIHLRQVPQAIAIARKGARA